MIWLCVLALPSLEEKKIYFNPNKMVFFFAENILDTMLNFYFFCLMHC